MLRSPVSSANSTTYAQATFSSQNNAVRTFGCSFFSVPFTSFDSRGTTECALTRDSATDLARVLRKPHPSPQDPSPKAYTICPTEAMGQGMFAERSLDIGDLILVERPLLVLPSIVLKEEDGREDLLKTACGRMSKENQEALFNLANAYDEGTPRLSGIFLTNAVELGELDLNDGRYTYAGVFQELSRVNHSCRPNCAISFHAASFSLELRATTPIAKGEQIMLSYCCPTVPTGQRQAALSRFKFSCTCFSCHPTPSHPSNDSVRVSISGHFKMLNDIRARPGVEDPTKTYEDRPSLRRFRLEVPAMLRDMEREGPHGTRHYYRVMSVYSYVCLASMFDPEYVEETHKASKIAAQLEMALDGSSKFNPALSHYLKKD